jgi:hypothetical protein
MNPRSILRSAAVSAVVACFGAPAFAGVASPGVLDPGLYELHNHNAAFAAPPPYGLRLDELVDVSPDHDIYTFDFDHDESAMFMDLGPTTLRIFGTVYGGLNEGDGYAATWSGRWAIDFTYAFYDTVPGDDDYWTSGPDPADHWGTITALFGDGTDFWLQDEGGGMPFSFRLGDEDDDAGHRGEPGVSGWGWLNHAPVIHDDLETRNGVAGPPVQFPHSYDSDWIFTVGDRVPEPGSAALLALAGALILRRR